MIKTVLIFNRHGNIRFFKTFTPIDVKNRTKLKQYLYLEINKRTRDNPLFFHIPSSEFYEEEEEVLTVIYRKFATLYFVFICDDSENILSVIDFIHVFVEVLDNYFNNVCELDIVFHFNEVHDIFKEIVHNGIVIDTSVSNILENITEEKNKAANESSLMIYGKDKIDKNQSIRKFIEHSPYQVEKNYASIVRKIRSKFFRNKNKYNDMFNYQDNFRKSQRSCIDPFPRPPEYYKKVTPPMNKPMVQSGYNFNVESFHRNWSDCLYHKKSFGNGEEEDDDLEEYVLESKKLKLKEKLKIILLLTLKYLLILLSILFILLSQVIYLNIGLRKSSSDKSMSSIQHYGNNFCSTDERACCTQYLQLLKTYKKYGEFNEIIKLCKNNQLSKWSIEIVHHRTQFLLITIILLIIYSMELSHIIWYEWKIVKFNTITLSTLQLSLIIIFELFLMISQIFIFQYIILINNRYLFELIIFQLSFLILIDYLYRLLIKYLSTNKYSFEFTTIRCNDGFSRKFTISHYPDNMKQLRNLILNNYSKKFSKLNPSSLHLLPTDCDIINIFLRSILTSKIPSYSPPTTNSTVPWNETNSSIESASTTTTPGTKILKLDGEDKSKNSNGIFLGIGDLWGNLVMNMEQRNLIATSFTYISSSFSMWTKTIKCVEESGNIYQATYDELAQLVVGCLSNINISYVISREDKLQLINQIASCIRWECKFKQSNFIPNDTIENSNNHSFQDLNEKFDYSYYSSKSDQNLYYFYINSFSNSHKIRLLTVIRRILKEKWAK